MPNLAEVGLRREIDKIKNSAKKGTYLGISSLIIGLIALGLTLYSNFCA